MPHPTHNKEAVFAGRTVTSRLMPPFYGITVTVALYHTQGGIRVNPDAQVLRKDGSGYGAIPSVIWHPSEAN
jgi:hypothetical protein